MIIDFSVQNFGSIKDKQTLSFEATKDTHLEDYYVVKVGKYRLLKLALIYGANASGKTTVLKALNFLKELLLKPRENKSDTLRFYPFLFDKTTPNENSTMEMNFIINDVKFLYKVEFNRFCIVREELDSYKSKKANVFIRTTDTHKQLADIVFGSSVKADKALEKNLIANTLWNNTVFGGFMKTNIDIEEIRVAAEWFTYYLSPLINPKIDLNFFASNLQKDAAVSILKNADFNISGIKIEEKENVTGELLKGLEKRNLPDDVIAAIKARSSVVNAEVLFEHEVNGKNYHLPIQLESDGTRRYFGMAGMLATLILDSRGLIIDELESSLHPDLFTHFILSFLVNAKKSQLIATTHNREILSNKDIFRNDAIWFTDKSQTGATELYSLADFGTDVVRDSTNVLNAYKTGKLGGVPNLGDYYIDLSK